MREAGCHGEPAGGSALERPESCDANPTTRRRLRDDDIHTSGRREALNQTQSSRVE